VLVRARARSRSGKLVEELIAQRDTGITDVAAQAANWLLD
jgi:hypothetical protein